VQQSHADALWRRARRPLSIAVIYVLAWYPLDQASQKFQTAPDVSVWYPPAGLDVGLLLVFGLRYAPLLLLNSLAHTLVLTRRPIGPAGPLIFDLVAPLAYTVAAALLLRVLHVKMLLANPHYGFRARQTACDHACHRPVRRAPLRFASSIMLTRAYATCGT